MKVFILDDSRTIQQAIDRIPAIIPTDSTIVMSRPFRWSWAAQQVTSSLDEPIDAVLSNPVFDIWILDNDLGGDIEGFRFLQHMASNHPEKLPNQLYSCSANPSRKEAIESYFYDFKRLKS